MGDYKKAGGFGGNRDNNNFRDRREGGRPSFGGGNRGGDRGARPAQMHSAICDECKKSCQVPFRPSGDKPVYCSDCFGAKKDGGSNDRPTRDFGRRDGNGGDRPVFKPAPVSSSNDNKNQFDAINAKLDKLINLLSKNTTPNVQAQVEKKVSDVVTAVKKEVKDVKKAVIPVKKEIKKDVKKIVAVSKRAIAKVIAKKKK